MAGSYVFMHIEYVVNSCETMGIGNKKSNIPISMISLKLKFSIKKIRITEKRNTMIYKNMSE